MPITPITFLKGDKIGLETDYRDGLPENMYAIKKQILGADGYMKCYPGLVEIGQQVAGYGIDRGGVYNERFHKQYRISGLKLIEVNVSTGAITDLGDVTGTEQVAMPLSFNTQAIIANEKMYLYDSTIGFREVTDIHLGSPIDCVWIDGYYFLTDGEYIYHTDITDESAIDPLKYATAEFMPDLSVGLGKTQDNKVIVFGRYTTEYFQDTATVNFAFTRISTRAQKIGIVATHAKCEAADKWYIVGGRKEEAVAVHVLLSGMSEKISTREVDKIIAQYTELELVDTRLESYTKNGITFILIHLPNETLCFNESIAKDFGIDAAWFYIKSGIAGASNYRAINGVFDSRVSKWVYGDKRNENLGILDDTVFTHYNERNEWVLYSPFLNINSQSINDIEIETVPGSGVIDDDATVAISLTYDGIHYGAEWFKLYGASLDYSQQFIIRRLGYVSSWVGFKFRGATKSRMAFALMRVNHD